LSIDAVQPEHQVRGARTWFAWFLMAAALYGSTMTPGLSWGDSGEAQLHTSDSTWLFVDICRSHVAYYACARLVDRLLPFGPAVAANLVAMLFGAVTVASAALLMARLCPSRMAAGAAAPALLLSHTLWQMSTAAEVVTMSTALLACEWLFVERYVRTGRRGALAMAGLCNGLGVSTHNMAMLMWPVYAFVWFRCRGRPEAPSALTILLAGAAAVVGMAPMIALCAAYWTATGSAEETLQSALFGTYRGAVLNVAGLPGLVVKSAGYVFLNFPLLTPIALLGVRALGCTAARPVRDVLIGAGLVYTLFALRYNVADQYTFFTHVHVLIAIFCAVGLNALRWRPAWMMIALAGASPILYALLPPIVERAAPLRSVLPARALPYREPARWFLRPWRCGDDGAERYARELLESLPPGALLWADSTPYPPIAYLQRVESVRTDVLLDGRVADAPWIIEPAVAESAREASLRDGAWFSTSDRSPYLPPWLRDARRFLFEQYGHAFRVIRADPIGAGIPGG